MSASSLPSWLLAQIAADEAAALAAVERNGQTWRTGALMDGASLRGEVVKGNPRSYDDEALWDDEGAIGMWEETAAHIARHDPARVLAEVEAKRAIVALHKWVESEPGLDRFMDLQAEWDASMQTLRALAKPYAGQPGWQEAWRCG